VEDSTVYGIGAVGQQLDWDSIDWESAECQVTRLRQRIYRATCEQKWNKVRSLMKLMLRSRSNLLLSVRRVTQTNKGKGTPGIDGKVALTNKARVTLIRQMEQREFWKARPSRRIYIPKAGKPGQLRPLSIPTLGNRIAQAIIKNALEPSWEARFEAHSYGFRPGRSCHDAIQQCWNRLNKNCRDQWILDADIKGAFDNISQKYILDAIGPVPGRQLIKRWLAAGYVESERFHKTESGTGQGAVISPLLANIALDGMQLLLGNKFGFIRYADDFAVTAKSKEQLEKVKPTIEGWLAERGLALHPDKTSIVKASDGFNFLGYTIRTYRGRCLTTPQKDKVLKLLQKLKDWLKDNKPASPENVIRHFNDILRGWCNYYKTGVSSRVFGYVHHQIWKMLWKWCLHRHPNKNQTWVRKKYFGHINGDSWTFCTTVPTKKGPKMLHIFQVSQVKIERHVKVIDRFSPDDPGQQEYWLKRRKRGSRYTEDSDQLPHGMRA
jgi:RNA-directed DNA polymerase